MAVAISLAYYDTSTITAEKSFIVHASGPIYLTRKLGGLPVPLTKQQAE